MSVLVVGFGNPAREDDGIGPLVAAKIEELGINGVTVDSDYQLTVEHAKDVCEHETVIFVDASTNGDEPFSMSPVEPETELSFSSHSVSPAGVIGLAENLFGARPRAFILEIRGYSFGMFTEELTEAAERNSEEAVRFLCAGLESGKFISPEGEER